jgi:C4-dicarboxylate-specific signal transduction histidine kinase
MKTSFDRARLVLLGLLLALLGVGLWAYHGVGNSLRDIRATGLRTLLNTQVGTLEQWVAERRHEAEQLAADEELGPKVQSLALGRGGDPARITRAMLDRAASIGITAVLLIAPDGRILAASESERIGRRVSADFLAHMATALAENRHSFAPMWTPPGPLVRPVAPGWPPRSGSPGAR